MSITGTPRSTAATIDAMRRAIDALVDTIRDCGPMGCPSGVLYAGLMTTGVSLSTYERIIEALIAAGRIERRGHVLYAS